MEKKTKELLFKRDENYFSAEAQKLTIYFDKEKIGELIVGLSAFNVLSLVQFSKTILCLSEKELFKNIRNESLKIIFQFNERTKFFIKGSINKNGFEEFSFLIP